jgi:nucleoside-diphosphate-sugar epimerase
VDIVFHTAAHVSDWGSSWDFEAINVHGTENLLQAAAAAGVRRLLHVSTACVYDDQYTRRQHLIGETAPTGSAGDRTFGLYARSKLLAEQAVWRAHQEGRLAVSVIRPAWIYGPGDRLILPELVGYLRSRLACWLSWGNPSVDPIYVTDVADCALAAATHEQAVGQAYNVAPEQVIGVRDFVGALCRELGLSPPRYTLPAFLPRGVAAVAETWARWRGGVPPVLTRAAVTVLTADLHHDPQKAMQQLGWRPLVSVGDGVRRTVAWLGQ